MWQPAAFLANCGTCRALCLVAGVAVIDHGPSVFLLNVDETDWGYQALLTALFDLVPVFALFSEVRCRAWGCEEETWAEAYQAVRGKGPLGSWQLGMRCV